MSEKKEYIERGAALGKCTRVFRGSPILVATREDINAIPAADVEPVVRCINCVAYMGKERKGGGVKMVCGFYKCETSPEHFCAHGKERER